MEGSHKNAFLLVEKLKNNLLIIKKLITLLYFNVN